MDNGENTGSEKKQGDYNTGNPLPPAATLPTSDANQPHGNEIQHTAYQDEDDPKHWFQSSDWWMVILTAITVIVAAITLRVFYKQFQEMKTQTGILNTQAQQAAEDSVEAGKRVEKQLEIARNQTRAAQDSVAAVQRQTFQQERPWVAVSVSPMSGFTYDATQGGVIMLKYTITNVGHSLAKYTSIWTALPMNEDWAKEQKRICGYPKARMNAKSDYGLLLFPTQTVTSTIPANDSPDMVKKAMETPLFKTNGVVSIDIVVCVDYQSVVDSVHHQTRIVRTVAYPNPVNGAMMGAFYPKKQYSGLEFLPIMHGDSAD